MAVATKLPDFLAAKLLSAFAFGTIFNFIMQWIEKDLDQGMGVLAVEVVVAVVPAAVLVDIGTAFWVIQK